ncbi:Lysine biosynthesis regulatory protein LYS14 [Candida viswanathii]|uniref:Lysine biosynthesis regulatory protein LYS14 n=1 Tax=Candida viswanathii TaxID=5486 RepID=A0A367XN84_9ASCO|nr:Lysine biosynthesis regulatory protein LYS14 [Candida viswanathii]
MTTSTNASTPGAARPKIKKSKYSRGGCQECKRRKIKCDETKPFCFKCTRLNKVCRYPNNSPKFKFEHPTKKEEAGISGGHDTGEMNGTGTAQAASGVVNGGGIRVPQQDFKFYNDSNVRSLPGVVGVVGSTPSRIFQGTNSQLPPPVPPVNPLPAPVQQPPMQQQQARFPLEQQTSAAKRFKISDMLSPPSNDTNNAWDDLPISDLQNLFDDASLLVHDSLGLFSAAYLTNLNGGDPLDPNNNPQQLLNPFDFKFKDFEPESTTASSPTTSIPRVLSNKKLIESVLKEDERSAGDVDQSYLDKLTNTRLGYNFFPFADSVESNQVVLILLKYLENCNYLLLALLAASATFQFIQNNKKSHYDSQSKYTNLCLKHLSSSFPQNDTQKESFQSSFIKDIEKLLLTILVLTMNFNALAYYNRSNMKNNNINWKTHLRGVNELLLKYTKLCPSNQTLSDGVALAKNWFFAIESVAELNDPCGGTIKYHKKNISQQIDIIKIDDELETSDLSRLWVETGYFNRGRNLNYHDALLNLGMLTSPNLPLSSQFSLYLGYSVDVVMLMDKMTRSLDLVRSHANRQISGTLIANIFSFINKGRNNDIVPKANKETFVIPIESVGHPEYDQLDKIELPKSCYCYEITPKGEKIHYSWFDWSEQLHIDTVNLKLLRTKGLLKLPKLHPLVQELKNKILDSMFFIKQLKPDTKQENVFIKLENFYLHDDLFDERAMMIQSCFRECSKVATQLLEFEKLELFFRGLSKLGNGSSLFGLESVGLLKDKFIARGLKYGDTDDDEQDDDGDIIPFC